MAERQPPNESEPPATITTADLAALSELQQIGRGPLGTTRLAWTDELAEAESWFVAQAAASGLSVQRDPAGNLWAVPAAPPPWWALGSHLDSVREGGSLDGALGVAAAFAVARTSSLPLAVISFADEEGARFNTPTFGSRALIGTLDVEDALAREDDAKVTLRAALAAVGLDPDGIADAQAGIARLRGFLELHIDQSTDVADAGAAVAWVSGIAARRRVRVEILGASDHAGATPPERRRDALSAAAAAIGAAELSAAVDPRVRSSANRILVEPNAATAIAARAVVWLDARSGSAGALDQWLARLQDSLGALALQRRVEILIHRDAASDATIFAPAVAVALRRAAPPSSPNVLCYAGHDAANLAAHVPAGMILVRNPTGVSHAPDEHVSLEDAAIGATTLLRALRALAAE